MKYITATIEIPFLEDMPTTDPVFWLACSAFFKFFCDERTHTVKFDETLLERFAEETYEDYVVNGVLPSVYEYGDAGGVLRVTGSYYEEYVEMIHFLFRWAKHDFITLLLSIQKENNCIIHSVSVVEQINPKRPRLLSLVFIPRFLLEHRTVCDKKHFT